MKINSLVIIVFWSRKMYDEYSLSALHCFNNKKWNFDLIYSCYFDVYVILRYSAFEIIYAHFKIPIYYFFFFLMNLDVSLFFKKEMRNRENSKTISEILLLIYVEQKTIYHLILEFTNNVKNVLYSTYDYNSKDRM